MSLLAPSAVLASIHDSGARIIRHSSLSDWYSCSWFVSFVVPVIPVTYCTFRAGRWAASDPLQVLSDVTSVFAIGRPGDHITEERMHFMAGCRKIVFRVARSTSGMK